MGMKIIRKMKGIDVSCVSPSSTAICSSIDQHHMVKNTTNKSSLINNTNYNHSGRCRSSAPCISELPFTPTPRPRPSSFSTYHDKTRNLPSHPHLFPARKSSADAAADIKRLYRSRNYTRFHNENGNENERNNVKAKQNDKSTPVFGSEASRTQFGRMLEEEEEEEEEEEKDKIRRHFSLIDVSPQADDDDDQGLKHRKALNQSQLKTHTNTNTNTNTNIQNNNSSLPNSRDQHRHQVVVVLRVSLHCRGCENKLRRHLSKMDGVASYNIDMETKKVTVVGNVTPFEVLTNISKVKNAQLWPSQPSSSSSTTSTTFSI